MPHIDRDHSPVPTYRNNEVLTTEFGTALSGWASKPIGLFAFNTISIQFDFVRSTLEMPPSQPFTLYWKFVYSDPGILDLNDYYEDYTLNAVNQLVPNIITTQVPTDLKGTFRVDTRASERLVILARVDDAASNPTLSLKYYGFSYQRY